MTRAVEQLDIETLGTYLQQRIDGFGKLQSAEKFAGGQSNPTFLLTADSGRYVLRRKPPGELLKSAHAVDREFRVISALAETDVPVAKAYHLCEDETVIGSMFYVMSFEEGRVLWDPALPEAKSNEERGAVYREMVRVLAAMHDVDVNKVGLADYGKPGNYFERQVDRWTKQYRAAETDTIDAMEELMAWLPGNIPDDDGQISLVHGDYRLDNVMFDPAKPEAIAVLDWELSTLGHPLADLGYYCMCLRFPNEGGVKSLGNIDRHALGIPSEEEIIQCYCEKRGIDAVENWHFYLAFSFFRLAGITQGVYKRALIGNASNEEALAKGKLVEPLAQLALEVIQENGVSP